MSWLEGQRSKNYTNMVKNKSCLLLLRSPLKTPQWGGVEKQKHTWLGFTNVTHKIGAQQPPPLQSLNKHYTIKCYATLKHHNVTGS